MIYKKFQLLGKNPTVLSERQGEASFGVLIGFRILCKCKWREALKDRKGDKKLIFSGICRKGSVMAMKNTKDAQSHWCLAKLKFKPHTILSIPANQQKFKSMTIPSNDDGVKMWRCVLHY